MRTSANPRAKLCLIFGKPAWQDLESYLGIHTTSLGLVNRGTMCHGRRELQVSKVSLAPGRSVKAAQLL